MSKQFEQLLDRTTNGSMKWEASYIEKRFGLCKEEQEKIYPLFIADMDYPMDPKIHQELLKKMQDPDFGYYHIQENFYESIQYWYAKTQGKQVKREWLLASIGTITTLNILCDQYARNKKIAMLTPVYGSFQNCSKVGETIMIPLKLKEMRYVMDMTRIEKAFAEEGVKVLLFCNPHNPSGRCWEKEELKQLVALCKQYDVLLLSDEIHSDIQVSEQPFVSLMEFFDTYDRIVISTSPNKTFNISALCTSYLICANAQILKEYQEYLDRLHLSCNRMGIEMCTLVYEHGYDWLTKLNENIKENIALVEGILGQTDMKVMMPDRGYLVWIYLPNVHDVDVFVRKLAKTTHVLIETGSRFLDQYQGWIRVNTATSKELLKEAMYLLKDFYLEYKEER